jgi:Flp pilus assembly protein TadG
VTFIVALSLMIMVVMMLGVMDISQTALAKSRLQAACDAGVLAARKAYTPGTDMNLATQEAQSFFRANFPSGVYSSEDASISLTDDGEGQITANAAATVRKFAIFGDNTPPAHLAVTCSARMDIPNTDIIFALDTTSSMGWTDPGDVIPRLDAAREAVRKFVERMEAIKPPNIRVRYGFVPFSETVNVGHLLRKEWMVDRWTYQSREAAEIQYAPNGEPIYYWNYGPISFDVSGLKGNDPGPYMTGTEFVAPRIGGGFTDQTISWKGCVEERDTLRNISVDPPPAEAYDLNIDLVPDPANDATRWRPHLPQLVFWRKEPGQFPPQLGWIQEPIHTDRQMEQVPPGASACPSPAQKLAEMNVFQADAYLSGLVADGPTYLDVPMLWAARLISPTGLFAHENAAAPNGGMISRHIIMLTDGAIATGPHHYNSYGLNALDQRQVYDPTESRLTPIIDRNFRYACKAAQDRGINVWMIAYGTSVTSSMEQCAGDGHSFMATNAAEVTERFQTILSRIGRLRLTQ